MSCDRDVIVWISYNDSRFKNLNNFEIFLKTCRSFLAFSEYTFVIAFSPNSLKRKYSSYYPFIDFHTKEILYRSFESDTCSVIFHIEVHSFERKEIDIH